MSIATGIKLHDIDDVEGFVISCFNRSGIQSSPDEREDLIAEGVCLLYELERKFNGKGRFSGYAAQFLPRRLGDAWHARNENHFRAFDETGKRRWQYLEGSVSLDGLLEANSLGRGADTRNTSKVEASIRPVAHWSPARLSVSPVAAASACA